MGALHRVVVQLMTCFALSLSLPEDTFTRHMSITDDDNGSALSFNWFPPVHGTAVAPGALRISPHTDFEVITLLFQSRPGLEICPGKDARAGSADAASLEDKWRPADPVPGGITCNLGDALQYLTDGRFRSTFHRVRVPRPDEDQGARVSLAYFANVALTTPLQGPERAYPPTTFLELLVRRQQTVPLDMEPGTGVVKQAALLKYHALVAGPEAPRAEAAGT